MLMHNHPVRFGAPRDMAAAAHPLVPLILQRSDDDFVEATLDDLRTPGGRQALNALRAHATTRQGVLKLFQPVQRQFHLVLLEAWCDLPGLPPIAPAKVAAAGLLLRRVGTGGRPEGWMKSKGRVRGWLPLARVGGETADPAAAHRLALGMTGVAAIDRQIGTQASQQPDKLLNEDLIPLYPAPPDVCADAGKTLYWGMVPTVSAEFGEAEPVLSNDASFGPTTAFFTGHLADPLRGLGLNFPFPGQALRGWWFGALESVGQAPPSGVSPNDAQFKALKDNASADNVALRGLVLLLRQLAVEFDAFGTSLEAQAVQRVLHEVQLPLVRRNGQTQQPVVRADDFLAKASKLLLSGEPVSGSVEMPERWPALGGDLAKRLAAALHATLQPRFKAVQGRAGRFDEPGAQYQLRAFLRLKPEGACLERIVWADPSAPFVIAPWYEGAGAPPVQVALPDPSDRELLKSLKPNVAFVVPPSIQNLLRGPAKDLMEGKSDTGNLGLTWICSFSIPVITICAFIVLNIFLSLFNIVFGWMFFLKICLPLPKFGNKPPPH